MVGYKTITIDATKILVAEDNSYTAMFYKHSLQYRQFKVTITTNGEECLKVYNVELHGVLLHSDATKHLQPFDVVILDYKMPKIDGLEVAKEILAVNPHQRIILTTAYLQDKLLDSVRQLNQIVEILNKPFSEQELIDIVEDKSIYSELKQLNVNIDDLKNANLRHEQLRDVLDVLKKQKEREDSNSSVLAIY
jgi:CheY-like chemotaxis protein